MRRALFIVLLALVAPACSGGPPRTDGAGRLGSGKPTIRPSAPKPSVDVSLPPSLPPASMFVGPASWRTGPVRYCLKGQCKELTPPAPSAIEGPAGSPVFFSLSAAPAAARLELAPAGKAASVVPLNPGTAMVWQASVAPGTYPMTLVATYRETEVAWPFTLRVTAEKKRS